MDYNYNNYNKRKKGHKTYNKEMEKEENYFSESDEKEDPKEIFYVSKDNEKKGSITESKIEEKVISDNKDKKRGKQKKIKKKDVALKLLLGNSDEEKGKEKGKELNKKIIKDKNVILKDAIKSKHITKIIFSFLTSNKILNMMIYNKYFQNLLNIGIENYKNICKRYIIGEINGKGKEYSLDKNILIFEGEYLNRKRNGKGIEYDYEGLLLFEGEYLNGKRKGKGKEYYFNGNLKFEGEYLNGEKNGKGKEYFINGNLYFIGEYLKGKKWNGKGFNKYGGYAFRIKNGNGYILIYNTYDELIFEGKYLNGEINGYGYEYETESDDEKEKIKFEGEYLNGIRNGKGKEYNKFGEVIFKGEYLNGKKWNCKMFNDNNELILELKNGKGFGQEFRYDCRYKYSGEFFNGEKSGKGKEYKNTNFFISKYNIEYWLLFEGEYLNGKRNGKGKKYYKDYEEGKLKFEGEYLNGKKWNGKGYDMYGNLAYEIKNGSGYIKKYFRFNYLKFEGEYLNGEKNGKGKEYDYHKNLQFEGEYLNGKRHGKGKEYLNKKLIFEGEYLNGEKWNGKGNIGFQDSEKEFELKNGTGKNIREYDFGMCYTLRFEGEYRNGKRNGKGNEYYPVGSLKFEGEYINGKRNGKGKEYHGCSRNDEIIFEGEYLNGKRFKGIGKEFWYDEDDIESIYFEGEYLYGIKWNSRGLSSIYRKNGYEYD